MIKSVPSGSTDIKRNPDRKGVLTDSVRNCPDFTFMFSNNIQSDGKSQTVTGDSASGRVCTVKAVKDMLDILFDKWCSFICNSKDSILYPLFMQANLYGAIGTAVFTSCLLYTSRCV